MTAAAAVAPPAIPIPAPPRHKHPVSSGAESDTAPSRHDARPPQVDALSDRSTVQLIRRTLCPQQRGEKSRDAQTPIEELLPPLTSRNDLDLQLYAFLAIILREFVQTWYAKITTDETFVAEIVHTIAHCTRALEQRLRRLDLESLVLDEIPDLLERHITGTLRLRSMDLQSRTWLTAEKSVPHSTSRTCVKAARRGERPPSVPFTLSTTLSLTRSSERRRGPHKGATAQRSGLPAATCAGSSCYSVAYRGR
jgi:hypothetical protein